MPELSRFFGIIIRMYMEAGEPHHTPHFHAYYQDQTAVISLEPVELIAGALPRRQCRFVEAWAERHSVMTDVSSEELLKLAEEVSLFVFVFANKSEPGQKRSFGGLLARLKDRVFSGYKIVQTRKRRPTRYRLESH